MANEFVARNGLIAQDNSTISGSLIVTNGITGSISGTGSYANAANSASYASGSTSASYAVNASSAVSASYALTATSASFATTASYWTGSVNAVTASFATNAGLLNSIGSNGFTTTGSFQTYTASNDLINTTQSARLTSLEGVSASFFSYTQSNDAKIASVYNATSSLQSATSSIQSFSSSILSYTASTNNSIGALNSFSSSILSYTSSTDSRISSINLATSSLNAQTASLLSYTSSTDAKIASIYNNTSSLNAFSGSILSYTASTDAKIAALYTYTSSLNNKTSSFATTGSNTFIGNQTITGSVNVSGSINATGTLTAQTLIVQVITSSQDFVTGSTKFGSLTSNTHQFTGSIYQSGSEAIFAGNVGIGTSSPSQKLHVTNNIILGTATAGSTSTPSYIDLGNNYSNGTTRDKLKIYLYNTGTEQYGFTVGPTSDIQYHSNINHDFYIANSIKAKINTDGLTITGNSQISGYTRNNHTTNIVYYASTSLYFGSIIAGVAGSNRAGFFRSDSTSSGASVWWGRKDSNSDSVPCGAIDSTDGEFTHWVNSGGTTGAWTKILTVNTSGLTINNGNFIGNLIGTSSYASSETLATVTARGATTTTSIGIGSATAPSYPLHVRSAGTYHIAAEQTSTNVSDTGAYATFYVINNATGSGTIRGYFGAGGSGAGNTDTQNYIYVGAQSNNGLRFFTNDSSKMTILSGGNVGIGTTAPSYKLSIVHSETGTVVAGFQNTSSTGYSGAHILNNSGTLIGHWGYGNASISGGLSDLVYFGSIASKSVVFTTNDTIKMTILSGGNVGIGTTSPLQKLDIRDGNIELSDTAFSNIPEIRFTGFSGGGRYIYAGIKADEDGAFNGHLEFWTTPSSAGFSAANAAFAERMRITSGGNVGIGTTSPGYKLEVSGDKSRFNNIIIGGTVGGTYAAYADSVVGIGNLHLAATGSGVAVYINSALALPTYINPVGGNVGIGNTSPTRKLHILSTDDTRGILIHNSSTTSYAEAHFSASREYRIGTGGSSADSAAAGKWYVYDATAATHRFTINSDGNVGIGTTNPTKTLTVVNTAEQLRIAYSSDVYTDFRNDSAGGLLINTSDGYIINYISGSEKMRITSSGSVGIGTSTPIAKLSVFTTSPHGSPTGISVAAGSGGANLLARDSSTHHNWFPYTDGINYYSANAHQFRSADHNTNWMHISSSGNVGIGSTTPEDKLVVSGGSIVVKGTTYPSLNLYTTSGTNWAITNRYTGNRLSIDVIGTGEIVNILSNGNVGIGTTSPTYKLEVAGDLKITTGMLMAPVTSSLYATDGALSYYATNNGVYLNGAGANGWLRLNSSGVENDVTSINIYGSTYSSAPGQIWLRTGGSSRIAIKSDGNVGIGTTDPTVKLDIRGGNFLLKGDATDGGILTITRRYSTGPQTLNFNNNHPSTNLDWTGARIVSADAGAYNGYLDFQVSLGSNANEAAGTAAVATVMRLTKDGNVGIGTTSPTSPLLAYRDSDVWHARFGSSTGELRIGGSTSSGAVIQSYTPGGTVRDLYIQRDGGSVGIGTTSPGAKLHVNGTSYAGTMTAYSPAVHIRGAYYGGPRLQVYGLDADANAWMGLGTDMDGSAYTLSVYYPTNASSAVIFGKYDGTATQYGGFTATAKLSNAGTWTVAGDVVAYGSPSDITLKTNIKPLEGALDKITKLQGVSFTWKENTEISKLTGIKDDIGFIAQEVQEVLPDLVRKNDNGLLSLRDKGIIPLLVEAIKELKAEIDILKNK